MGAILGEVGVSFAIGFIIFVFVIFILFSIDEIAGRWMKRTIKEALKELEAEKEGKP